MSIPEGILAVTVLSSIMAMLILGSLVRSQVPGVKRWMAGNLLAIVAMLGFAMRPYLPWFVTIVIANQLLALAMLLMQEGCRQFFGRPAGFLPLRVACVAVAPVIVYFTYVVPDFNARVIAVSVFHALNFFAIAMTMLYAIPPGRPLYGYLFGGSVALLSTCANLVRCVLYYLAPTGSYLLESTPINVIFLLIGTLGLPAMSIAVVMLAHDRLAARLEHLANTDELTGTLSRRALMAGATQAMTGGARTGTLLSVAVVDLDYFKRINDVHGHAGGDIVLQHFATLVAREIRSMDLFGRLGGEEFALVFPALGHAEAAAAVERLRLAISAVPCTLPSGAISYTFSAGIAQHRDGESLTMLLARADIALYRAKAAGRNRVIAHA